MNMKKEMLNILNQIEKYLSNQQYEELELYIKTQKLQINLSEEDKASNYIDELVSKLK